MNLMQNRRLVTQNLFLSFLLTLCITAGWSAPALAQDEVEPNQAGIVVVHADGSVISRCVGFTEESITGYDLLVRGEFAIRSDVTAMGASVCSVDGQGCGEGEDCFCQCQSSPCVYWTYWQLLPEGWRYSNAGPATVQVRDGDVQGWVWGESKPNAPAESAPPVLTIGDICKVGAEIFGVEGATAEPSSSAEVMRWGMLALVIATPLIIIGVWWLLQRRKAVQP